MIKNLNLSNQIIERKLTYGENKRRGDKMIRIMRGDKVLLKRLTSNGLSKGGILIHEQLQKPQDFALVIAVGPGNIKGDGGRSTMTTIVGDMVPLPKRIFGQPIEVDGVDYIICREFEIPMLLRDDEEEKIEGANKAEEAYENGEHLI